MSSQSRLRRLFSPKSVAVIGGGVWCRSVIEQLFKIGYKGKIFPVHPSKKEILGLKYFKDLEEVPIEIDAADFLTLNGAWRLDQNLSSNREIASAKLYATEMLARVTDATLQIHGGMGLMDDYPIERFWRDARVERIWDGTSEIQRHIISRDLLRPLGS